MTRIDPGLGGLLDELRWRGMFHAVSAGLEERLASGRPIAAYNGFDPSGPWLHIGNLVPIFGLIHLQRHGGRPVVVVGGGTGMVGDPSGRTAGERALLDRETLAANAESIREQLGRFLDFGSGPTGALMVNNLDWLAEIRLLDFLRDVGKHFTVPYMLAKDSVQTRLERGLSYTEFSYMLLQAVDFDHLRRTHGVELQMGGADQWGNITAGLELIRRTTGSAEGPAGTEPAFALAYPLLLAPSGAKFGKSEAGDSIWLHADATSPFAFYQYWLNVDDRDVGAYLRWFTTLDEEAVGALERETEANAAARTAQRALALDVTARVHGLDTARAVEEASRQLFGPGTISDPGVLGTLHGQVDSFWFSEADLARTALQLGVSSQSYSSNSEARRAIQARSFWINDVRIEDPEAPLPPPIGREFYVLRTGGRKKRIGRLRRG